MISTLLIDDDPESITDLLYLFEKLNLAVKVVQMPIRQMMGWLLS